MINYDKSKEKTNSTIVIDAQNFNHEKGLSSGWGMLKHAKETNMIENTKKTIPTSIEEKIYSWTNILIQGVVHDSE